MRAKRNSRSCDGEANTKTERRRMMKNKYSKEDYITATLVLAEYDSSHTSFKPNFHWWLEERNGRKRATEKE